MNSIDLEDNIKSGFDGALVNSTINIDNVVNPDNDSDIYVYARNIDGTSSYNFIVNINDSDGIYTDFRAGDSGIDDVISYHVSNHANNYDSSELWSDGFETINLNVTAAAEFTYFGNDGGSDSSNDIDQEINIVADADFIVTDVTSFSFAVGHVTLNISGSGTVDLGEVYLGDGDIDDIVTIDASALTGDFSFIGELGYSASITTGIGNDTISVGDGGRIVMTGLGLDIITLGSRATAADVDNIVYTAVADSQGITIDMINRFQVDVQSINDVDGDNDVDAADLINDVLDFSAIADTAGGSYLGEAEDYAAVLASLTASGFSEAVLDRSTSRLYVDIDGNGALTDADMAIDLVAVTDMSDANFVWDQVFALL